MEMQKLKKLAKDSGAPLKEGFKQGIANYMEKNLSWMDATAPENSE